MIKRNHSVFGLILVLCAVLALSMGLAIGTGAEDADNYYLTINFSTGCEAVELSIPGQATQKMESGTAYAIPKTNANITIRVVVKNGYEIDSMVGSQGDYGLGKDTYSRTWVFTTDDIVNLTCKPKEYDINYLFSDAGAHTLPSTGSFPKKYTFGDEGTKISMPVMEGFKFQYWILLSGKDASDETGTILSPKEGEDYVTLSSTTLPNTDTLYLRPKWEANQYEVYRYDYIYNPLSPDKKGDLLNKDPSDIVNWKAPMNSTIDGSMGEDRKYPGFVYINSPEYYSTGTVTVSPDGTGKHLNNVYRLYIPLEYVLEFVSGYEGEIVFPNGATIPEKHVYNVQTVIPDPIRTGFVFQGWTVTVVKNGAENSFTAPKSLIIEDLNEAYAGDQDTKIKLTAIWVSDEYTVHIDLNTGADGDQYDYAEKYVYDTGLTVTDPVRPGYTFLGWLINDGETPQAGTLASFTYASDITLTAQWKANKYTVTLDGAEATKPGTSGFEVTFDSPMELDGLILPEKEGHEFWGFATADGKDYIDAEGKSFVSVWDIPADTTLYAKWKVLSYKVTVNATNSQIYLNGTLYEGAPIAFPYGTTVEVLIKTANTHKVTAWEGKAVGHTHSFTNSFVLGAADVELDALVLPMIAPPAFRADYVAEQFTTTETMPNGNYQIKCGSETLRIKVTDGEIYVNDVKVTAIEIPESFFGKTVEFMTVGDGTKTADSDPTALTLAARPELPVQGTHIGSIYPSDIDSIAVESKPDSSYTYEYEFAVALNTDGTGLIWKSFSDLTNPKENVYLLDGLNPGTDYYVYVRVKASDGNYPHGLVNVIKSNTTYENYFNKMIDDLQKLIEETDGDIVRALVAKAIEDAKALEKPSATFYEDIQGIYNRILIELPFARLQDSRIAELRALRDALIATNEFSSESNNKLNDLCSTAVSTITATKTSDEVESIYLNAVANMKAVQVTYLFYEHAKLITYAGLPQGSKLFVQRMSDITALTTAIDEAIASGRLAVAGDSMTLAEALEAFRSLDVMAGYTVQLSRDDVVYTNFDGRYEIRVLLPEELWGVSGLQVAYYDEKSGIEVLDTTRDGNYLVFTADHIADFAILGDPIMNLTSFIIALGLILVCQLIAIILMLARRVKNARRSYHASFVIPTVALTVRFLPANGVMLALILGVFVVILQIVLMYLLLSTEMVHQRDRREDKPRCEPEASPAMAVAQESETYEDDSEEASDEETEYLPFMINGDGEDTDPLDTFEDGEEIDETAELEVAETAEEDADDSVYVDLRTGEVFGDTDSYEDFIEPAANPRYSLPEEDAPVYEEEPAYAEESQAEDTDEAYIPIETAEWQYDESEAQPEDAELPTEDVEEAGDGLEFEPADSEIDDYYNDSVRGELAEDIPQEEPVTGEPADDYIEEEPVKGDLPEYEQPADDEESKKYDGYEE